MNINSKTRQNSSNSLTMKNNELDENKNKKSSVIKKKLGENLKKSMSILNNSERKNDDNSKKPVPKERESTGKKENFKFLSLTKKKDKDKNKLDLNKELPPITKNMLEKKLIKETQAIASQNKENVNPNFNNRGMDQKKENNNLIMERNVIVQNKEYVNLNNAHQQIMNNGQTKGGLKSNSMDNKNDSYISQTKVMKQKDNIQDSNKLSNNKLSNKDSISQIDINAIRQQQQQYFERTSSPRSPHIGTNHDSLLKKQSSSYLNVSINSLSDLSNLQSFQELSLVDNSYNNNSNSNNSNSNNSNNYNNSVTSSKMNYSRPEENESKQNQASTSESSSSKPKEKKNQELKKIKQSILQQHNNKYAVEKQELYKKTELLKSELKEKHKKEILQQQKFNQEQIEILVQEQQNQLEEQRQNHLYIMDQLRQQQEMVLQYQKEQPNEEVQNQQILSMRQKLQNQHFQEQQNLKNTHIIQRQEMEKQQYDELKQLQALHVSQLKRIDEKFLLKKQEIKSQIQQHMQKKLHEVDQLHRQQKNKKNSAQSPKLVSSKEFSSNERPIEQTIQQQQNVENIYPPVPPRSTKMHRSRPSLSLPIQQHQQLNSQKMSQQQINKQLTAQKFQQQQIQQQQIIQQQIQQQQQLQQQMQQQQMQQQIQQQMQQQQMQPQIQQQMYVQSKMQNQGQTPQNLQQINNKQPYNINNTNIPPKPVRPISNNPQLTQKGSNPNMQYSSSPLMFTNIPDNNASCHSSLLPPMLPSSLYNDDDDDNNNMNSLSTSVDFNNTPNQVQNTNMNQSETRNNTIAYPQTYINPNLRKIYIPEELPDKFMEVAKSNTENNIETCGILCGVLKKDEFFVTTVILPKQTGSSDTCNTLDEVEVLNIQEKYELLTLGWIHTHPSQTGFLSSVDLHTHFSYQLMISEAIAIVCSPKYTPKVSYFRLTDNNGMNVISSCKKNGFHPHHENVKLFYDAFFNNDNGHVYNIKESVIMMDLRN